MGGEVEEEEVVLDGRVTLTEGNLTFTRTQREDAGVYKCFSYNNFGDISAEVTLTVFGELRICWLECVVATSHGMMAEGCGHMV